ncbi:MULTISPECIES: flavin reductase family protein [Paenibacillus]|uniref:flavin reductase family protein n=1 Tax=Paenibacillus TaxID=44249 RepID=UPI002FE1EE05
MRSIDPDAQSERDNYKLLTGTIIPRPIALVTTLSASGILNAAPFSYFNIVTADPPMISVSVQRKQGQPKDTARNALERGAFVVHIADESYIAQVNTTASPLPPEESEAALAELTAIASERISVPGVAEAKVRMECLLEQALPIGGKAGAPAADLLIGRVVRFHIAEAIYEDGRIDAAGLGAVSRLAGQNYARIGGVFSLQRPE